MMRFLVGFLTLLGALAASPAGAGDVFTVRGVAVDATADNAATARVIAVADGQRRALDELLHRLTLPEDWNYLPSVDEELAQSWVRGFQIANEKTSATRYLADLSVSFQPAQVRNLLRARNIPFSESQAKPVLVLPVLQTSGATLLWEEPNPWRAAWAAGDLTGGLVPMVLALGDVEDLTSLDAGQAMSGDEPAILALAARNGVEQVIVALARMDEAGALDVALKRYGAGEAGSRRSTRRLTGAEPEALMREAVQTLSQTLAAQWKRETIVYSGEGARLQTSAAFGNLAEWQSIRQRLDRVSSISATQIIAVSSGGAHIEFDYAGTLGTLTLGLKQQNLQLTDANGQWVLSLIR